MIPTIITGSNAKNTKKNLLDNAAASAGLNEKQKIDLANEVFLLAAESTYNTCKFFPTNGTEKQYRDNYFESSKKGVADTTVANDKAGNCGVDLYDMANGQFKTLSLSGYLNAKANFLKATGTTGSAGVLQTLKQKIPNPPADFKTKALADLQSAGITGAEASRIYRNTYRRLYYEAMTFLQITGGTLDAVKVADGVIDSAKMYLILPAQANPSQVADLLIKIKKMYVSFADSGMGKIKLQDVKTELWDAWDPGNHIEGLGVEKKITGLMAEANAHLVKKTDKANASAQQTELCKKMAEALKAGGVNNMEDMDKLIKTFHVYGVTVDASGTPTKVNLSGGAVTKMDVPQELIDNLGLQGNSNGQVALDSIWSQILNKKPEVATNEALKTQVIEHLSKSPPDGLQGLSPYDLAIKVVERVQNDGSVVMRDLPAVLVDEAFLDELFTESAIHVIAKLDQLFQQGLDKGATDEVKLADGIRTYALAKLTSPPPKGLRDLMNTGISGIDSNGNPTFEVADAAGGKKKDEGLHFKAKGKGITDFDDDFAFNGEAEIGYLKKFGDLKKYFFDATIGVKVGNKLDEFDITENKLLHMKEENSSNSFMLKTLLSLGYKSEKWSGNISAGLLPHPWAAKTIGGGGVEGSIWLYEDKIEISGGLYGGKPMDIITDPNAPEQVKMKDIEWMIEPKLKIGFVPSKYIAAEAGLTYLLGFGDKAYDILTTNASVNVMPIEDLAIKAALLYVTFVGEDKSMGGKEFDYLELEPSIEWNFLKIDESLSLSAKLLYAYAHDGLKEAGIHKVSPGLYLNSDNFKLGLELNRVWLGDSTIEGAPTYNTLGDPGDSGKITVSGESGWTGGAIIEGSF